MKAIDAIVAIQGWGATALVLGGTADQPSDIQRLIVAGSVFDEAAKA